MDYIIERDEVFDAGRKVGRTHNNPGRRFRDGSIVQFNLHGYGTIGSVVEPVTVIRMMAGGRGQSSLLGVRTGAAEAAQDAETAIRLHDNFAQWDSRRTKSAGVKETAIAGQAHAARAGVDDELSVGEVIVCGVIAISGAGVTLSAGGPFAIDEMHSPRD